MFDNGVTSYIEYDVTISIGFPIDSRGNEHVACKYCKFCIHSRSHCLLTDRPVLVDETFRPFECPLKRKE